jgi:hypothetical protein
MSDGECCSSYCQDGACAAACASSYGDCTTDLDCCDILVCEGGLCVDPSTPGPDVDAGSSGPPPGGCVGDGLSCASDGDCCGGTCDFTTLTCAPPPPPPPACGATGDACIVDGDCCSGLCDGGTCG